jgi:hypothetical protein
MLNRLLGFRIGFWGLNAGDANPQNSGSAKPAVHLLPVPGRDVVLCCPVVGRHLNRRHVLGRARIVC